MRLIIREVEALVSKYGSSRDNIFLLITYTVILIRISIVEVLYEK